LLVGALVAEAGDATAAASDYAPIVTHTGTGPTGYTVTLRLYAPDATRVQVKGEWYFERPGELDPDVGTEASPTVPTQGILPGDWKPGDVPIAYPNASAANWPVADLTKDPSTGVWSYTTPLPSGVFSYGFFVNCASDVGTSCTQVSDPSNLPWNQTGDTVIGSKQASSQVYVPSDPAFNTIDYSWMGSAAKPGTLTSVTYTSPGHVTPTGANYAVVYTPPGYDAARAKAYPTLYLSHGGGGNETDWTTQGAAGDVLDNLIASGRAQPMVVVMTNNNGFASSTFNDAYDQDMINNLIPYVEGNYNVIESAQGRAFAGLSAGGIIANSFMIKYPETFQYYNEMSAGLPPAYATLTTSQAAALRDKDITLSSGRQDPIWAGGFGSNHTGGRKQAITFASAGLDFTTTMVEGGHEWYVWRLLLQDFVEHNELLGAEKVPSPTLPVITMQPVAAQTVSDGATVTLVSLANGNPQPTVQWQVSTNGGSSWADVASASSEAYTFQAQSGRRYRAAFNNATGTVYSSVAVVTIKATTPAKTATTTNAKLARAKVVPTAHAKVQIRVRPAAAKPTGKVIVHYGEKSTTVKLKAAAHGTMTVVLPRLKKGTYKVYATYAGSSTLKASSSARATLKVARR
jgi:enterochelin esterase-like enzyme